nr:non-POU domain-containing octamer-binding protein-like [Nicotiana tomentosiformis]
MIKVSQSNHLKRRSWTCGLRQLVACIRGESTALDHGLNRKVAKITELYFQERAAREEDAKRREEEDRRREEEERRREEEMRQKDDALRLVTSDVKSLESQINPLLASGAFSVHHSPASDDN